MVRAHAGPLIENEALTIYVSAFLFFCKRLNKSILVSQYRFDNGGFPNIHLKIKATKMQHIDCL